MKVKNKRTKERIQLSYAEFQTRFAKEIKVALESFIQTENNKPYFKYNKNPESNFYLDLQWNFNHFRDSVWYIEQL